MPVKSMNKKATKAPFCKVCFDTGKPESVYTSHFVRDVPGESGVVVCPTLLDIQCRYCKKKGHTTSKCPILKKKGIKVPAPSLMLPEVANNDRLRLQNSRNNSFGQLAYNSDDEEDELDPVGEPLVLNDQESNILIEGSDLTIVANSFSCLQAKRVIEQLERENYSIELIDLRILNPLKYDKLVNSVKKTGRLLSIDGGWTTCGVAGEIIAGITERIDPSSLKTRPVRLTLTDAPAPTSKPLENEYYLSEEKIINTIKKRGTFFL